jgi:hypothetical protein
MIWVAGIALLSCTLWVILLLDTGCVDLLIIYGDAYQMLKPFEKLETPRLPGKSGAEHCGPYLLGPHRQPAVD